MTVSRLKQLLLNMYREKGENIKEGCQLYVDNKFILLNEERLLSEYGVENGDKIRILEEENT